MARFTDKLRAAAEKHSGEPMKKTAGSMIVQFHPMDKTATIISAQAAPEIEGKVLKVQSTGNYMEQAKAYATSHNKEIQDAASRMVDSTRTARAQTKKEDYPDMMFYLPSAWVDSKDETVLRVNYTPRSLGCPDLGMNSKSPFDDYGIFAVDLLNFSLDPEKSNNGKDTVEYLIAAKNAPIRVGSLKSNAMLKALNEDILNPRILDAMHLGLAEGGALRSGKIDLRFMTQAFKYSVELPGLPGMRVFEGFIRGWAKDAEGKGTSFTKPEEYIDAIVAHVTERICENSAHTPEEVATWVREKAVFHIQSAHTNKEFCVENKYGNSRLLVPLKDSCCIVTNEEQAVCRKPMKTVSVVNEAGERITEHSKYLYTFRSLAAVLEGDTNPVRFSAPNCFVTFTKSSNGGIYAKLQAVQMPQNADELEAQFSLHDGATSLSGDLSPQGMYDFCRELEETPEAERLAKVQMVLDGGRVSDAPEAHEDTNSDDVPF